MQGWTITLVGLLALALVAPAATAHSGAIVVQGAKRCYIVESHGHMSYWVETNGFTTGGTPLGTGDVLHQFDTATNPVDPAFNVYGFYKEHAGTGLQRAAGDFNGDGVLDAADTQVLDRDAWAAQCLGP